MSALVCSMSGETPNEPVVSRKSGHLFEKRLVSKYVEENGTCPVSGEELSLDDLVDVKANNAVKPRPTTATGVPGLLQTFQGEWDAAVKECFELRKLLEQTRQELSHTLYQHDAACRVIAKVIKERDEARRELAEASANGIAVAAPAPQGVAGARAPGGGDAMEVESEVGITDAVKARMTERSTVLSKARKKREISATLATEEEVAAFTEKSSHPVHLANPVLCLDLHPSNPNLALTGGADNKVVLLDRASGQAKLKLDGHSKKVTKVAFHPTKDLFFSASSDKTVRVWEGSSGKCLHTLKDHAGEVTGVTVHATGDFLVTASADKTWAFYDIASGVCRKVVSDAAVTAGYSAASFHPDGLILGTGTTDNMCRVWDVKTQQNVVSFGAHVGAVTSLSFSENGYYLSTTGSDGFKVWDLRKVAKQGAQAVPVKSFTPLNDEANEAVFDFSGQYLALAGGKVVQVYHTKTWAEVLNLGSAHTASVTGVRFGADAKFLASASKDRTLKFFG
mmetsp:Transcript_35045/g.82542  ORF Transcript_35045/g.82542 Transcript_35045/m.82542 type:complete len:508 (+) Transcript_35045:106-1629(+)|eukprot:CAMPEP_0177711040 /NCGR_PEP_ID=MMETSP0484_2-20121128/11648_1 /TAXON_ID=354590 /ORGANISM="Rhodomonas lens, Strain RHODO" /LENGTH=507 /DNA_ID=CAMNT_0019222745 /DNA_START=73 /DNA_END=1596 /DNA_ORIENTATION=-